MKEQGTVVLSERLKSLAEMVTCGSRVADVGCDHGFVSIYLVQKRISPKVLAMDVREGPLSRAREHVAEYGLGDYRELRAGMGGRLMQKILERQEEKSKSFKELILQPQSELPQFRRFLRESGYTVVFENILCEEGKYYFLMKAVTQPDKKQVSDVVLSKAGSFSRELCDKYGGYLLGEKHPVLREFLKERRRLLLRIQEELVSQDKERAMKRLTQVRQEIQEIEWVLEATN